MIKIGEEVIAIEHYPDGTPKINIKCPITKDNVFIAWKYENDSEIFYLFLIKKYLDDHYPKRNKLLTMYYMPNARMDRVKNTDEVFTLKFFCNFINDLNFTAVRILDPHSNVAPALLNHCCSITSKSYVYDAISATSSDMLYFPDAGAAKKYSELLSGIPYCYGEKKRDWLTGKILGLEIKTNGQDLSGKNVLMVDDIISYGGSMYYSALELKKCGVNKICAFATHTEDSVLDKERGTLLKLLEDGTVEKLYTTNSLFRGNHEKITVREII